MTLNLPEYNVNVRRSNESKLQIFDCLRAKFVSLTPEEWVRQHFVNYLINFKGYPISRMANEVGLNQNGLCRRCDTVVYDSAAYPLMIVEYKAPTIAVSPKVFDQIVRYNMVMRVPWLAVSNGMRHYCCRVDFDSATYRFVKEIPEYPRLDCRES